MTFTALLVEVFSDQLRHMIQYYFTDDGRRVTVLFDVILICRLYLPGIEPGISRSLVGITTVTP